MTGAMQVIERVRYEQKAFWRNRAGAFFVFLFPIMFLVIFATLNAGQTIDFLGGIDYNQYYICGILAFGVMSACYTNLAIAVTNRRELGILKRLRGMPVPSWLVLAGLVGSSILVSGAIVVLTGGIGLVFYGFELQGHYLALAVTLALGAACFCALGLAVQTLVANADAAPAIVNGVYFPVVFLSGVFFPTEPGSWLSRIADYLPVRPFVQAIFTVFDPRTTGLGFDGGALLRLAIWTTIGVLVAVRRFKWEPRRS